MSAFLLALRMVGNQRRLLRLRDREIDALSRHCRITSEANERLVNENRTLRSDCDLLALCIHPKHREAALAFVRDRRRISRLDETTEVAG